MKSSERNLIIGKGQIGTSLYEVLEQEKAVFIRDIDGPDYADIDVLHIAFPYSDTFVDDVASYRKQYDPDLIIVYSTVPIGTCAKIGLDVVHSPIEGRHPHLAESIEIGVRWVGCFSERARFLAVKFWRPFVKKVRATSDSTDTEFLKIRSTAKYGVNLVWADYEAKLADKLDIDFEAVKTFDNDYNDLYAALGYPQFKRYILDPPDHGLGGHCLIENAVLLNEQYPHPLLEQILGLGKDTATIQGKPYHNRAWLYAEYVGKGKSSEQIGREWGCTGANILRVMKQLGIKRRDQRWTDSEVGSLEKLAETLTFKEVAEELGRSHDAVRIQAIKMGLDSIYNPGERGEKTRIKISATLQGITVEDWGGFQRTTNELIRRSEAYKGWRKAVFERDDYTCQHCGARSGPGQAVVLHADHIKPFSQYPDLRLAVDNGRTLCEKCHRQTPTWGANIKKMRGKHG